MRWLLWNHFPGIVIGVHEVKRRGPVCRMILFHSAAYAVGFHKIIRGRCRGKGWLLNVLAFVQSITEELWMIRKYNLEGFTYKVKAKHIFEANQGNDLPLPPLILWTWSAAVPKFMSGSKRARPTDPSHSKRQKAFTLPIMKIMTIAATTVNLLTVAMPIFAMFILTLISPL